MEAPFFEVENLTRSFGELEAARNISFSVKRDEIVGLIGPNGAGKTTLIRLIMHILKPDSGRIRFNGEDITRYSTQKIANKGVVATFQVVKPFRSLPCIGNVMVGAVSPRARKEGEWVKRPEERAMEALEYAGIADLALEPARVLAHGDLKRLEIARAIITEPELLILDEPFGGLNASETGLLAKSLKRLHKGGRFGKLHSEGPAMLIVEHKLIDLMKIVDRVIVLNFGEVITEGTPGEISRNKDVIEAYIGKEAVLIA